MSGDEVVSSFVRPCCCLANDTHKLVSRGNWRSVIIGLEDRDKGAYSVGDGFKGKNS
jgi:hypothetical protein